MKQSALVVPLYTSPNSVVRSWNDVESLARGSAGTLEFEWHVRHVAFPFQSVLSWLNAGIVLFVALNGELGFGPWQ